MYIKRLFIYIYIYIYIYIHICYTRYISLKNMLCSNPVSLMVEHKIPLFHLSLMKYMKYSGFGMPKKTAAATNNSWRDSKLADNACSRRSNLGAGLSGNCLASWMPWAFHISMAGTAQTLISPSTTWVPYSFLKKTANLHTILAVSVQ